MKMETNHYPDGTKEYKDRVSGGVMIVRFKNNALCLSPAIYERPGYGIKRNIELTDICKVVSIKDYDDSGKLLLELKGNELVKASAGFYKYLEARERMEDLSP